MPTHPVRSPEWIDSADVVTDNSIVIAGPPSAVWAHIADHESWPRWFDDLDRVERVDGGESVGAGRRVVIGRMTLHEEFTAWDPHERFSFAVVKSPLVFVDAMAESVELSGDDERCTVRYRQGVSAKRFLSPLARLMGRKMDAGVKTALSALQRRVETGR